MRSAPIERGSAASLLGLALLNAAALAAISGSAAIGFGIAVALGGLLLPIPARARAWIAPPLFAALQIAGWTEHRAAIARGAHLSWRVVKLAFANGNGAYLPTAAAGVIAAAALALALVEGLATFATGRLPGRIARPAWIATVALTLAGLVATTAARRVPVTGAATPDGRTAPSFSTLALPRHPLRAHAVSAPDILWIVLDSVREDSLTPSNAPAISAFADSSLRFTRHYSGGNETEFGLFTMLYGVPTPWVDAAKRPPLLRPPFAQRLAQLDYRTGIEVATDLDILHGYDFGFDETHRGYAGKNVFDLEGMDRAMVDDFLRTIPARTAKPHTPRFDLLFLCSTHLPYWFDEKSRRHRPDDWTGSLVTFDPQDPAQLERMRNRYRNAITWVDSLTGRILHALYEQRLLDDTIVVITADHGESLGEHGVMFHANDDLNEEETHVPLLLRIPGRAPGTVTRVTSHVDLVPTFLSLLGVENPPSDFSTGVSLLDATGPQAVTACTEKKCAVIDSSGLTQFGILRHATGAPDARARLFLDDGK